MAPYIAHERLRVRNAASPARTKNVSFPTPLIQVNPTGPVM